MANFGLRHVSCHFWIHFATCSLLICLTFPLSFLWELTHDVFPGHWPLVSLPRPRGALSALGSLPSPGGGRGLCGCASACDLKTSHCVCVSGGRAVVETAQRGLLLKVVSLSSSRHSACNQGLSILSPQCCPHPWLSSTEPGHEVSWPEMQLLPLSF